MWRIGWKSTIFAVVLALAMVWTPALAETAAPVPGSGPEIPVGLVKEWTELGPNATRWHAFYFSHPHAMRPGEKMEDTTVAVRLESVPKAAAKFEILTQKEVDLWAKAEKYTAVGQSTMSCGCKPEDEVRKSDWVGMPYGHQMTYVLVKNTTDKPLNYRLLMDDSQYVSFPAPIAALPTEAELAAAPVAAPVAAVAMTTAPTAAATAPNLWFNLQPGTDQWLEFAYVADKGIKHDKEPPAFELTLFVEDTHPLDSVYFDVFTDAEYQQLINKGEDITGEDALKGMAVGCGTDNGAAPGILNWKGAFKESQTIHVRVREGMCHPDGINVMLEAKGTTLTPLIGS